MQNVTSGLVPLFHLPEWSDEGYFRSVCADRYLSTSFQGNPHLGSSLGIPNFHAIIEVTRDDKTRGD